MARYFVTFGQRYRHEAHPTWPGVHPDGWVTIDASDLDAARARTIDLFGVHFCDVYPVERFDRTLYPGGELVYLRRDDDLPFVFERRVLANIRQLLEGITTAERDGKATDFLATYRAYTEHADVNIGYLIGYVEPYERRRELYAAYDLVHPIAGGAI